MLCVEFQDDLRFSFGVFGVGDVWRVDCWSVVYNILGFKRFFCNCLLPSFVISFLLTVEFFIFLLIYRNAK